MFFKKAQAIKYAQSHGALVWPMFYPCNNPKKPYVMKYGVSTLDEFMLMYMALGPEGRVYCEMLPDNVPLKLYMDVEYAQDMNACVGFITACVAELTGLPDVRPFQVDASNEHKASRHLIWPLVMKTKERAQSLVWHVERALREQGAPVIRETACGIDLGVYDKERGMRLCYSHKVGDEGRKFWPYPDRDMDPEEAMQKSMIAFFMDGLPTLDWKGASAGKKRKRGPGPQHQPKPAASEVDSAVLARVSAGLARICPNSRVDKIHMWDDDTLSVELRPGVWCPMAGRIHSSNCTWLHVDVHSKVGHWICSAHSCKVGGRLASWGMPQF